MTLIGISLSLGASRHSGDPVPTIQLSATSIAEDAASGSVVGALSVSNGSGSYTYSITSDPDSKFAIDGSNLETAATLDYETDTSHSVTIEADNGVDDPISRVFTITVTNVLEVTLSALTLSADEWTIGTPSDGTIDGDTAGSSISVSGTLPTGLTIDTTARTWDWDGTGSVSTGSFDLVETHVDASNSPRTSTISWGIVEASLVTASAPWTPADAPAGKIKGWWDVSDAANRAVSAGKVDSLTDKSGNGVDLFGGAGRSGATKPGYNYDYFAMDSAGFNKVSDVLCSTADLVQAQPFAVYQSLAPFVSTGNDQTAFDGSNTVLFRSVQGAAPLLYAGSVGFVSAILSNDPAVTRARFVSGTGYLSKNAGTETSASVGSNGINGKIRLGDSPTNDAPYHGHIRETVLTSEDVTPDSDLDERLIGYLAWRGGTFETLPSGHTYRYKAPKQEITAATVNVTRQPSAFIPHGASTSDYHYANIFDPCIVEHPTDPTKLVLYASGQGDDTGAPGLGHHSIGRWEMDKATPLATPTFTGVVLDEGPGWDATDHGVRLGSVLLVSGTYYMYYTTQNTGAGGNSIGVATSTDGITWTKQGSALLTPSDDETALGEPAIWWEGGVATIIYDYRTSADVLPGYRFATASSLTGPFTKQLTADGEKDIVRRWRSGLHVEAHQIVKKNGRYYLLCEVGGNVTDATPYRLYLASCDTISGRYVWEKEILRENSSGTTGVDDKFHVATVGYYVIEGDEYLYWTGAPDKAQPYGENHWNMYAGPISGLFDELP